MSFWRPSEKCIYVVPDIHGKRSCLDLLFKRILPLRKEDEVIFLGDYIDRGPDSPGVLDFLCDITDKYPDQVKCLTGNHEWLMLASIDAIEHDVGTVSPYKVWTNNGGIDTIKQYVKRHSPDDKSMNFPPKHRLKSIIPDKHLDFLLNKTYLYYEKDDYIFVHAGCDPYKPMSEQTSDTFLWDGSLCRLAIDCKEMNIALPWKQTVVCGHSYVGPIIMPNYIMLDGSKKNRLYCLELNSMESYYAVPKNKRLVKFKF